MNNPTENLDLEQTLNWFEQPVSRGEFYALVAKMLNVEVQVTSALSNMLGDDVDDAIPPLKAAITSLAEIVSIVPDIEPDVIAQLKARVAERNK